MILIGTKCQLSQTVTQELTAAAVGSGALAVFGTPLYVRHDGKRLPAPVSKASWTWAGAAWGLTDTAMTPPPPWG